jgi:hypothetical protein
LEGEIQWFTCPQSFDTVKDRNTARSGDVKSLPLLKLDALPLRVDRLGMKELRGEFLSEEEIRTSV